MLWQDSNHIAETVLGKTLRIRIHRDQLSRDTILLKVRFQSLRHDASAIPGADFDDAPRLPVAHHAVSNLSVTGFEITVVVVIAIRGRFGVPLQFRHVAAAEFSAKVELFPHAEVAPRRGSIDGPFAVLEFAHIRHRPIKMIGREIDSEPLQSSEATHGHRKEPRVVLQPASRTSELLARPTVAIAAWRYRQAFRQNGKIRARRTSQRRAHTQSLMAPI